MQTIPIKVDENGVSIPLAVVGINESVDYSIEKVRFIYIEHPIYDGQHNIAPTSETQVLDTKNKLLRQNIVVDPIPHNYGLVTWNGAWLTIS